MTAWASQNQNVRPCWVCCGERWWRWQCWQWKPSDMQSSSQVTTTNTPTPSFHGPETAGRMPFLSPNLQHQTTEYNKHINTKINNKQQKLCTKHLRNTKKSHNKMTRIQSANVCNHFWLSYFVFNNILQCITFRFTFRNKPDSVNTAK